MVKESQKRAIEKYYKEKGKNVNILLRKEEDADIIESLESAMARGYTKNEWLQALYNGKRL